MSRHASAPPRPRPRPRRRRRPLLVLASVLATLALAAGVTVGLDLTPGPVRELAARAPLIGARCPSSRLPVTTVSLTVAPELSGPVRQALEPLLARTLPDRECIRFTVQAQDPVETVRSAQILPLDRAPDIWVPDSSLWTSRVPSWPLVGNGPLAGSPVVIATSQRAAEALGWTTRRPNWPSALAGNRPLAVPRIAEDAAGLSAVIALWQALGKGDAAQRALAGTVLAAGRAGAPTEEDALAAAQSDSVSAPLLPTSEQAVTAANAGNADTRLVAVSPTGGSPSLDYPLLTLARPATGVEAAARGRAVRAVITQLLSARTAALLEGAGFRVPAGDPAGSGTPAATPAAGSPPASTPPADGASPSTGASPSAGASPVPSATGAGSPVAGLRPEELAALVQRVTALSAPSRFLTVFDLSPSMAAPAGNGQTRIEFAATAAMLAGELLTDRAQVGLWGFSRDLSGKRDVIEIQPIAELGGTNGRGSHRDALYASMRASSQRLGGNGTALFTAAVAGMTEMKEQYDPRAGNAVVLFTDGENEDPGGPGLKKTLAALAALYDPQRPVRLVCIGIGSGVDMKELQSMAQEAGGQAFLAKDPRQLPQVLFDVMNRRSS